jgi:hypothetical protein
MNLESEWQLILGGAGSPNKVELFNWRTNQQCQLPDLPVGVYGHVAAFMEGVPVFCEAGTIRRSCYKMDKTTKKWVSVSFTKKLTYNFKLILCFLNLFLFSK